MGVQLSTAVRNAKADSMETAIGTSPKLQIRTGAAPANPAAADSGTLLVEITLPSDWWAAASGGSKVKSGTISGNATATGDATGGHWRLKDNAGTTCHMQDGIASLGLSSMAITSGGLVTVNTFTWTEGNA